MYPRGVEVSAYVYHHFASSYGGTRKQNPLRYTSIRIGVYLTRFHPLELARKEQFVADAAVYLICALRYGVNRRNARFSFTVYWRTRENILTRAKYRYVRPRVYCRKIVGPFVYCRSFCPVTTPMAVLGSCLGRIRSFQTRILFRFRAPNSNPVESCAKKQIIVTNSLSEPGYSKLNPNDSPSTSLVPKHLRRFKPYSEFHLRVQVHIR